MLSSHHLSDQTARRHSDLKLRDEMIKIRQQLIANKVLPTRITAASPISLFKPPHFVFVFDCSVVKMPQCTCFTDCYALFLKIFNNAIYRDGNWEPVFVANRFQVVHFLGVVSLPVY